MLRDTIAHNVLAGGTFVSRALEWIDAASMLIEILAVAVILVAIFYAGGKCLLQAATGRQKATWYHDLKVSVGKALLLGLELLVAADVVRTVVLEATLESVAVLGLLVLVRTVLGWTLLVEMEGRWPWQGHASAHEDEPPAGESVQAL
jgi:uncharacterized membrane protein